MIGPSMKPKPKAANNCPKAFERDLGQDVASTIQLPSMTLWLASMPPAIKTRLKPKVDCKTLSNPYSTQYAKQQRPNERLLPTRSDHRARSGGQASSTKLRIAMSQPVVMLI
mmetsp:Transcript_25201/g.48279  ORF Transcript_25201/g.48279 Transcript_25201/m.48279 type:complete len:112 (+) Transcript_25201:1075-1410(+)